MARERQEQMEEWAKEYKQQLKAERRAAQRAEKEGTEEPGDAVMADGQQVRDEDGQPQTDDKPNSKKKKKKKKDDDDIEIPPLPEEFLTYKINNAQSMDPDKNIDFIFEEPLPSGAGQDKDLPPLCRMGGRLNLSDRNRHRRICQYLWQTQ